MVRPVRTLVLARSINGVFSLFALLSRSLISSLHGLIRTILAPYVREPSADGAGVVLAGHDIPISGGAVTDIALVLHELATNAAKYGALAASGGSVRIATSVEGSELVLKWKESGSGPITSAPNNEGFGTMLIHRVVVGRFGGQISRDCEPEGVVVRLSLPVEGLRD
jgi:two-component sensor histidine kinase